MSLLGYQPGVLYERSNFYLGEEVDICSNKNATIGQTQTWVYDTIRYCQCKILLYYDLIPCDRSLGVSKVNSSIVQRFIRRDSFTLCSCPYLRIPVWLVLWLYAEYLTTGVTSQIMETIQ